MFPLTVILNRLPFAPAALPAFIATIGISDFLRYRFLPRCLGLSGSALKQISANEWISWVTAYSQYQTRNGLRSRVETTDSPCVTVVLLLAGVLKPSALSNRGFFGTQHLHGRHYPLPLFLACFRTYASSNLLPSYLQGSILGLWLAVTEAGFPPARICDIAQSQLRLNLNYST